MDSHIIARIFSYRPIDRSKTANRCEKRESKNNPPKAFGHPSNQALSIYAVLLYSGILAYSSVGNQNAS
jgi:hypothetical protein